jgi:hypothetical protein
MGDATEADFIIPPAVRSEAAVELGSEGAAAVGRPLVAGSLRAARLELDLLGGFCSLCRSKPDGNVRPMVQMTVSDSLSGKAFSYYLCLLCVRAMTELCSARGTDSLRVAPPGKRPTRERDGERP